jgi:tRNA nucleotidyltransferase (CCA-adding enzyme)
MEIITSHTNADFDALASMVAAKKLYPEAVLVFAGSQERTMRDFFQETGDHAIPYERLRNIDVGQITRLIIVDNRNPHRLGKLAEALGRPGVAVHVYDHHPPAEGDVRGEVEVIEEVGATTTLMIELLRKRGISVTAEEATVLAMGIYEETGSLTYVSTTARDAEAAAWVIGQGADLTVVSDYLSRELTPEQVSVLNELMSAATSFEINGVKIVIAAAATPHFLPDLAALAHRMRDRESIDVLFLVVQMGDKTHIIGRARLPQVHAGKVLEAFGGGGHQTAASAVAKESTYLEAKERLIDVLKKHITPGRTAADIMTAPVKTIRSGSTVQQAGEAMTRFSVNVLPVMEHDRVAGIITREVVQKALFHEMGRRKADEFMSTGISSVGPDLPMSRVERVMIEERQRFLPVIDAEGALVGAITRTDLLRSLHEERFAHLHAADAEHYQVRNVRGFIEERVPAEVRDALKALGETADEAGFPVFLVGGIVRDLFLRQKNLDVDIVVEGDGITFAGLVVRKLGGRMRTHQKFGTAVVVLPSGLKIDVATARLEYYEAPGALPTVELSSIKKDLYRRDFTINTLAVRLNRKRFGQLIDFFGGLRDLKERNIRILHNLSFVEDPTRVFRAIRFEQRFQFQISKHTQNLIKSAVKMRLFRSLSGERIYDELVLMFSEADPLRVLRRMHEFDLLKVIHPSLRFGAELERLFSAIGETLTWYHLLYLEVPVERWFVYLLGFLDRIKDTAALEALERLAVPPRVRRKVTAAREHCRDVLYEFYRNPALPPSRVYDLLRPLDIEQMLLMMAKARTETAKRYVSQFLTHLREVKVVTTGEDLKRLGIPPGPRYKRLLSSLLDARLDGTVSSPEDEIAFVRKASGV